MAGYIPKMMPRATEMAAAPRVTPGLGSRMVLKDSLPTSRVPAVAAKAKVMMRTQKSGV